MPSVIIGPASASTTLASVKGLGSRTVKDASDFGTPSVDLFLIFEFVHYHRLYSLDTQIQHADQESLWGLATWIIRKWKLTEAKRIDGEKDVRFSMKSPDFLRAQWAEQVKYQTRPLPRQSRTAAKKAAQDAVRLRNVRDTLRDRVHRLEAITTDLDAEPYEVEEAQADLDEQKSKLQKAEKDLRVKERSLGIEANAEYRKVASSPFVAACLNAKAVKLRLREKLKARKFERDRLERSFRRQINSSERRLQTHTADAVKRRDPGIESLACGNAPRHAVAPRTIPTKELFTLDVDDSIWDDVGLDETTHMSDVPPWLGDDQVRTGIRGILLRDRCDEELRRLMYEHRVMREWFAEEWTVLEKTIEDVHESEQHIIHQLQLRHSEMCRLCVIWGRTLSCLPPDRELVPWGPSETDLHIAAANIDSDYVSKAEEEEDGEVYDEIEDEELDFGLLECMDALDLTEAHYTEDELDV
ncbi:hypothetical protein FB446DRAFT_790316 [Lentinula raphanica]|nr:hypothetical protein FB446DRAFT_790316 [Lentinula raphanica]